MSKIYLFVLISGVIWCSWGFYGHKQINKIAVFTLPQPLYNFYRTHIGYITERSVNPDKRRYATRFEGPRHYIDIDHWGEKPFRDVPKIYHDAIIKYSDTWLIRGGDSLLVWKSGDGTDSLLADIINNKTPLIYDSVKNEIISSFYLQYQFDQVNVDLQEDIHLIFNDRFGEYGILPYHIVRMQNSLKRAFLKKDNTSVLRLSAEIGHYIADAHVPLHTTENYNGQLTNQIGIHAFWESRIPELFAEEQYNLFSGEAEYVEDVREYVWNAVEDSHRLVDSVLSLEWHLRHTYPEDEQYCFDERLERTVRLPCRDYAEAYQEAMDGMVEKRMRDAIRAIGSLWYTAWVDAGMPDMGKTRIPVEVLDTLGNLPEKPKEVDARPHEH